MNTFEEMLAGLLATHLVPLRAEIRHLSDEIVQLRRALPPLLVPLKEAAKRVGVSYATARRRADTGEWPVRRDGGRILVDLGALRPKSEEEIARLARQQSPEEVTRHGRSQKAPAVGEGVSQPGRKWNLENPMV